MQIMSVMPAFVMVTVPGDPSAHHHGVLINNRFFVSVRCTLQLTKAKFRVLAQSFDGGRVHSAFLAHTWQSQSVHSDLAELSQAVDGQSLAYNSADLDELSTFFALKLDGRCEDLGEVRDDLASLEDLCPYPAQGNRLLAAHFPYVNAQILNLVTEAIVSRTFRFESTVFMSDCRTGSFSQGAPLFRNDKFDERMRLIIGLVLFPASLQIDFESGYYFCAVFKSIAMSGALSIETPSRAMTDFGIVDAGRRVVLVNRGRNFGSGVVIGKKHVLTCAHVLSDVEANITIRAVGNEIKTVQLELLLETHDIAVLKITQVDGLLPVTPLTITPRIGDEVAAYGYPLFSDVNAPTLTSGIVSAISTQDNPDCHAIYTSCSILQGFSGGGLFTRGGFWVGMIRSATRTLSPPVNMALAVDTINHLLRENGIRILRRTY